MTTDHITTYSEIADLLDELPIALRAIRRARGLSMRETGRQAGVSFATVARIEAGEAGYTIAIANAIALLRWLDGRTEATG